MPQLDIATFTSQVSSFFFFYIGLYLLLTGYVLPALSTIQKVRARALSVDTGVEGSKTEGAITRAASINTATLQRAQFYTREAAVQVNKNINAVLKKGRVQRAIREGYKAVRPINYASVTTPQERSWWIQEFTSK